MKNSKIYNIAKHAEDVKELSPITQLIFNIKGSDIKNKTLLEDSRKCADLFADFLMSTRMNLQNSMAHFDYKDSTYEGARYVTIGKDMMIDFVNEKTGSTLSSDKTIVIIKTAIDYINYNYNKYKSNLNKPLFKLLDDENECEYVIAINIKNFRYIPELPSGYKDLNINTFEYYK